MNRKGMTVLIFTILGVCFCFSKMTSCEMHRHGTYAPNFAQPHHTLDTNVKKVPNKDGEN